MTWKFSQEAIFLKNMGFYNLEVFSHHTHPLLLPYYFHFLLLSISARNLKKSYSHNRAAGGTCPHRTPQQER